MQYPKISKTGTGRSAITVVDDFQAPFNLGVGTKVTGTVTYNIEYSLDDPNAEGYSSASATWYIAASFSASNASAGGNIEIPCRAVSINVTAGTGTVEANIVQAGPV